MRGHCKRGWSILPLLLLLPSVRCFCPFRCVCNEDTLTVWCDGAALDVVPITLNPVLQELHLNGNKIKSITASFTVYNNLRFLDMSQNMLQSLGVDNFVGQTHLRILHLNNNKIGALKAKTFVGLSALKILRLDGNVISDVEDSAFQPMRNLENLDLSRNSISTLTASTFSGMSSLKELLLRDNKLTRVPSESFQELSSLESLDLGMNYIYVASPGAFQSLAQLKALSLDSCGIHIIEKGAFLGLDHLESLFLQDNDLKQVPTETLLDASSTLQELHVGKNKLRRLAAGDFRGLGSLRVISVNGEDDLEAVENGTFSDNHLLERIVLSHNRRLSAIEPGTFQGLENLKFLSLRADRFATFGEDLLPWDRLEAFDVRENPLACNCSVQWLWALLRGENVSSQGEDVTRVRCQGPLELSGQFLVDVSPTVMDCRGPTWKQILAMAIAGAGVVVLAVVLTCFWHRYKDASKQKSKLGQSKRTLYQYGQPNSENFSPILSTQNGQQPFKYPAIAEL